MVINMSKILVTGGAGFIGSHLVDKLIENQEQVVILDDLSSGSRDNLKEHKNLTFIKGDIKDLETVQKVATGCKTIFHLAEYLPNTKKIGPGHVVKYSYEYPIEDFEVSVRGTLNVLETAKKEGANVLFTSTAAVYGEPKKIPITEDHPKDPTSPYGLSKFVAEQYCNLFSKLYGVNVIIVRLFNVYGPRQDKYVAYDVIKKIKKNPEKIEVLGNGEQIRDFVYVKDAVNAILLAREKGEPNKVYNIGNTNSISIKDLVDIICNSMNKKPKIKFTGESWKGDIKKLIADNTEIKKLGYNAQFSIEKGINDLIESCKDTNQ